MVYTSNDSNFTRPKLT